MTVSQSETPAAAPQAGADISSTKSSVAEEELQSLVSTLAERISLLESQKNDNNNNDVDPNNRATRRANPNRLLWQKRDAAANGSPAIKLVEGIPENNTDDIEEAINERMLLIEQYLLSESICSVKYGTIDFMSIINIG